MQKTNDPHSYRSWRTITLPNGQHLSKGCYPRRTGLYPFEGAIDEGEANEEVLRRYEMEANGDERGLEEDSSDDEYEPLVPSDWDSYNFSQLSVNPG
jgi:hypothetical protein